MSKKQAEKLPPKHCCVPGTHFTVDWHSKTDPKYIHSFLSHAHTDHLTGIGCFRSPRVLHCTEITKRMVLLRFPKLAECIQTHEYGDVFELEGVKIHVFEANHTPGSAMFLFELANGKKYLHSGDVRGDDFVIDQVRSFAPIDSIYLDCTYGTSKLSILPRDQMIEFVSKRAKEQLAKGGLFLIGTYTIGKEELVVGVAKAIGKPIYTPPDRYRTIKELIDCGWASADLFVQDPSQSPLHLMPIQKCGSTDAAEYAKSLGYTCVGSVRASGWGGRAFWQTPFVDKIDDVDVTVYNVPYSDHSSPEQLVNFVKACRPTNVISTTQFKEKEIAMLNKLFFRYIRKDNNKRFIDYYASPPRPHIPAPDDSQGFGLTLNLL